MCDGDSSVLPGVPSPKLHWYDTIVPSVSTDPVGANCTTRGDLPEAGVAAPAAVGETFGGPTLMLTVVELVRPSSSVTVSVAVYRPCVAYRCDGLAAVLTGVPSPKSHE